MNFFCFILLQIGLVTGDINKLIGDFKTKPGNGSINVSVSIRSLDSGKEVYGYSPEMNLPPASTLKLLTTATALEYLSGDYRFETMVYSNGRVHGGKIQGDLLIEGIGDPSFGSTRFKESPFQQILDVLKEYEVTHIEGSLRVLNNDNPKFPLSWLVGDMGNYFGAFSNNFNYNENLYTVYLNGGSKVGDPVGIADIRPFDSEWRIKNDIKTGPAGSGDNVNILNLPFSNDIKIVGTVPQNARNFAVKGAIPNVNRIFTDSLKAFLEKNGIAVSGKLFAENLQNEEMGSVVSPDIRSIAKECNYQSVNIFADGLANFMWETDSPSYETFLRQFWKERGVDLSMHRILDGSGLAPQNTFSCHSMTAVLHSVRNNKDFVKSIPVAGRDGTVANWGKNTQGKIAAKSGSISGVRNYSGYFTAHSGKKYAFSLYLAGFNSNPSVRVLIEDVFTKMLSIKE